MRGLERSQHPICLSNNQMVEKQLLLEVYPGELGPPAIVSTEGTDETKGQAHEGPGSGWLSGPSPCLPTIPIQTTRLRRLFFFVKLLHVFSGTPTGSQRRVDNGSPRLLKELGIPAVGVRKKLRRLSTVGYRSYTLHS